MFRYYTVSCKYIYFHWIRGSNCILETCSNCNLFAVLVLNLFWCRFDTPRGTLKSEFLGHKRLIIQQASSFVRSIFVIHYFFVSHSLFLVANFSFSKHLCIRQFFVLCSAADDDFLVQVRAQVMTRDDSSGGWLPRSGGGMSVVGVQAAPSPTNSHYMIRGRRVCDQAVSDASLCPHTLL